MLNSGRAHPSHASRALSTCGDDDAEAEVEEPALLAPPLGVWFVGVFFSPAAANTGFDADEDAENLGVEPDPDPDPEAFERLGVESSVAVDRGLNEGDELLDAASVALLECDEVVER